jgi:hypothetical protein
MLQENLQAYGFVVKNANVNIYVEISTQMPLRKIMNYAEETETIAFLTENQSLGQNLFALCSHFMYIITAEIAHKTQ